MERLKKAKEDMERDVPFDELQSRIVARKEIYDALENLSECAQKARVAREGKMTERAINKDAEAKTDELLVTKEGQKPKENKVLLYLHTCGQVSPQQRRARLSSPRPLPPPPDVSFTGRAFCLARIL